MIDTLMNSFVLNDTIIKPIINNRFFPNEAINCIDPYIVYSTIGPHFIDTLTKVVDLKHMNFSYNCYAIDKQLAYTLANRLAEIFARDTFVQISGQYVEDNLWIQCTKSDIGMAQVLTSELATSQPQHFYPVDVEVWYKNLT